VEGGDALHPGPTRAGVSVAAVERIPLDSDALASLGYDPGRRLLEVEFTSGRIYRYFDVPEHEVVRLMQAASRGAYFSERVRDRYRFEQVH
jgi:hypothetical protein